MDTDLAFYTNEQLLRELLNRKSFVGIILTSKDESYKRDQITGVLDFVVLSNSNLRPAQILQVLTEAPKQVYQQIADNKCEKLDKDQELF